MERYSKQNSVIYRVICDMLTKVQGRRFDSCLLNRNKLAPQNLADTPGYL